MATAEQAIKVFRGELDERPFENPPGSNCTKYNRVFGAGCVPWCATSVWWVLAHELGIAHPKTAYTPTIAEHYSGLKRFGHEPRAGALALFNFPDSLDRIQHVGLVISFNGSTIRTIEGNTSSGDSGSQDNGGGIYERIRTSSIVGYAYPLYTGGGKALPRFDLPKARAWFGKGDKGGDVKTWQRDLNRWMRDLRDSKKKLDFDFGKIDDDGHFGRETEKATITFQRHYKLDADGRVGKHTINKMERVRRRQKS